jgi:DNA-binding transcriptional ArsR family regulator
MINQFMMKTHQKYVSQICRTIAHTTRLKLLWDIFEDRKLCVRDLANRTGISEPNASNQLKALAAKELIEAKRGKLMVFYRPSSQPENPYAQRLLPTLHSCKENKVPFEAIIHAATAFTHERRIQIVSCLAAADESFDSLLKKTGMTTPALNRHLKKLIDRDIIHKSGRIYKIRQPGSSLARCLLGIATQ